MKIISKDFKDIDFPLNYIINNIDKKNKTENIELVIEKNKDLTVSLKDNKAKITGREVCNITRGLGILLEKIKNKEKEFEIKEKMYFDKSGVMFDMSRNAVLKVSVLKEILAFMATIGLNTAYLYMEDTYEVKEYPYFGYMRGRYSFSELKEIDDFAYSMGIEVIPCIQTLAHLQNALRWPYAAKIKDTNDILLVDEDETYKFIEALIKNSSEPFRTKRIHLGMDEAMLLGGGIYRAKNGAVSSDVIIKNHLERVNKIVNKYGLEPIIWSDMYFRLGSKTHDYYDPEIKFTRKIKDAIPDNLTLCYWDYYHTKKEDYSLYLKKHKELTDKIIFAGGIWLWHGLGPKNDHTRISTDAGLTICKENNIKEVMATIWGDDGAEVNILNALYGMVLYSEHTYSKKVDDKRVREKLSFIIDESADNLINTAKVDEIPVREKENDLDATINPSKWLLFQDLTKGLFDYHVKDFDYENYYKKLYEEYKISKVKSKKLKLVFEFYEKLSLTLSQKANLGVRIKKYYDNKDFVNLKEIADYDITELQINFEKLRVAHRDIWYLTNKTFGFEIIDDRYGGMIAKCDTTKYILKQYINKKIDKIEELEQERLPYTERKIPLEPRFDKIAHSGVL